MKLLGALLFIVIGFAGRRLAILDEKKVKRITWLATNCLFPCLLFHAVYTTFKIRLIKEAAILFFLAVGLSITSYFLGYLFAAFLKMEERIKRAFLLLSFKPATGLIGIPLCIILFGEKGLFFAGPFAFGIGLIFYTLGLGLLKKGNFSWHTLVNPISVTIVCSVLLTIFKIKIPTMILRPAGFLGTTAVPVALVAVGSIFALLKFKKALIDKKMFLVAFNKLIFAPALIAVICIFLPLEPLGKKVAVLMAAMPSSVTASMWVLRFDADYIWASSTALFVGVSSIVTISSIACIFF